MLNPIPLLFAFNFSLLLLHEMDAIRAKEWRMFIFLKDMRDESAYLVFALAHLPLYTCMIFAISQTIVGGYVIPYLVVDIFLVFHTAIHFFFRKKAANEFTSTYSNILIYSMGALALIHLALLI